MRQCVDIWLSEARQTISASEPVIKRLFDVTKTKITLAGNPDWGVKLVTATEPENFQGYHRQNMTVVAEEASGISRPINEVIKGTLSNPNSLFVQIGNPNTRDCAFFDSFHSQKHMWERFTWNAEETARDYPWLLAPTRNSELEEEFGRDSDVYRVRVQGEFPHTDPNCVMSSEDLELVCVAKDDPLIPQMAMRPKLPKFGGGLAKQFGIDFARYGGDESTIYRRSGNAIVEWMRFAHTDPSDVCDAAFGMQARAGWGNHEAQYVGDAGGMGQGIMHKFYHAGKKILEFHNNGTAVESQMYDNKITEAWFGLAHKVRTRDCALPRDVQLINQMAGRQYYTTKKGKLVLETKDEYMKRGFNSPDRADGCVMAMYDPVEAVGNVAASAASAHLAGARYSK